VCSHDFEIDAPCQKPPGGGVGVAVGVGVGVAVGCGVGVFVGVAVSVGSGVGVFVGVAVAVGGGVGVLVGSGVGVFVGVVVGRAVGVFVGGGVGVGVIPLTIRDGSEQRSRLETLIRFVWDRITRPSFKVAVSRYRYCPPGITAESRTVNKPLPRRAKIRDR
jgi:hypothetical protein